MAYRVDIVFDGAVESQEEYADYETAQQTYALEIEELAHSSPEYDWSVSLWLQHGDDGLAQVELESHHHEAMQEYEVLFMVTVYADDTGHAEARAKQAVKDDPALLYAHKITPDT